MQLRDYSEPYAIRARRRNFRRRVRVSIAVTVALFGGGLLGAIGGGLLGAGETVPGLAGILAALVVCEAPIYLIRRDL